MVIVHVVSAEFSVVPAKPETDSLGGLHYSKQLYGRCHLASLLSSSSSSPDPTATQVRACEFSFERFAGIVDDGAGRARSRVFRGSISRGSTGHRAVLLYGGIEDLLSSRDRQTVLAANLACSPSLCTHFSSEGVDFFHDEFLHAFDRVLLLETKVEFLIKPNTVNDKPAVSIKWTYRFTNGFIGWIVPNLEIRVV